MYIYAKNEKKRYKSVSDTVELPSMTKIRYVCNNYQVAFTSKIIFFNYVMLYVSLLHWYYTKEYYLNSCIEAKRYISLSGAFKEIRSLK